MATPDAPTPPETADSPAAGAKPAPPTGRKPQAPGFLHRRRAAPDSQRTRRLTWAAVAGLAVLLVLQILIADRARLAADVDWRPTLLVVCGALGCDLPPWREPDAFTMLRRDVRTHPGVADALRVSATFRNDARWPQPWPRLLLRLSDINGRTVGARAFTAADYLDDTASRALLAPGQSATVTLDVREPQAQVVSFTFAFR